MFRGSNVTLFFAIRILTGSRKFFPGCEKRKNENQAQQKLEAVGKIDEQGKCKGTGKYLFKIYDCDNFQILLNRS